jgi:hypothetical protein
MPDAAPATPDTSTDLGTLTGGGPPSTSSAITDLTKLKKEQIAEETATMAKSDKTLDRDQARMEAAFKAEGVGPEELKPWDADKEHRRFEADPLQGIGSVGSLFAVLASAFTKAPATNAIQGVAGAINATKEAKEDAYKRAYDSYKENMKLALERHKIEHEQYQDATSLMQSNMAAGQAKMHNLAVKFGDQQTLMLLEHGMSKELFEMQAARDKAATSLMELDDKVTQHTFQKQAIDEIVKNAPKTDDPVRDKMALSAQIYRIMDPGGKLGSAEQEAVGKYSIEHWKDPPDQYAAGLMDLHQGFSAKAPNIEGYQTAKQNWADQHPGETMPAEEDAKLLQSFGLTGGPRGGAGGTGTSTQARKTEAIKEIQAKAASEGKPITLAEAEREYNKTVQIPSAHDVHQDDVQYAKAERMEGAMDELDELMLKHKLITGLGGTLTRPVEVIGNILGSNETDRKQFQRIATELKEWGQSVVNDRSGRPLSSEAKDAAVIFAGLNPGDTGPNTIRAIAELRPVIAKIKDQIKARGAGKGPVSGQGAEGTPAGAPPAEGGTDWLNAYPTKDGSDKRSENSRPRGPVMSDVDPDPVRPGARYAQADVSQTNTRSMPTFNLEELRPYRNKEIPPGSFPKTAVDNQENRIIIDKSYGNLDEFGYKKVGELKNKYKLKPGEKVLLIDKQGHQFGYQRDDNYEGGFTFWMPYEEQPGS